MDMVTEAVYTEQKSCMIVGKRTMTKTKAKRSQKKMKQSCEKN